jgi:Animal haem peroxidase
VRQVVAWARPTLTTLAASLALLIPGTASAQAVTQSSFGRMFPTLAPFPVQQPQVLADVVQSQLDPGCSAVSHSPACRTVGNQAGRATGIVDPRDNPGVPAGFTYLGQFIDHDLTLDLQPTPTAPIDPTTLKNFRTARFDLDSVYGGGPQRSPELYEPDGTGRLRFQPADEQPNGVADLPRRPDGSAIVGDDRNDENVIIAQMHLAFIMFHNRLIDEGYSFADARRLTQWHYQFIVVNDYLPHVAGLDRVNRFLDRATGKVRNELYAPGDPSAPMTPVEFSAAIFRYGHSQVRDSYEINDQSQDDPLHVFRSLPNHRPDPNSLMGGRNIPANMGIDWAEFFQIDDHPEFEGNLSRRLDTKISNSLFQLPIPNIEAEGSNVLAFRNLNRGQFYGLPSGQDVARLMGIAPLSNVEIGLPALFGGGEAPLWYYILAESEITENGTRLGPVAGRVVAEVLLTLMAIDPNSYLSRNPRWMPTVEHEGEFTMGDFLQFAGVVDDPAPAAVADD